MIAFTTLVWLCVAFDWRSEPESASNLTVVVVVYSNSILFAVRDQVIWSGFSSGSRKVDADPACCIWEVIVHWVRESLAVWSAMASPARSPC